MLIRLGKRMSNVLARYLNRKYVERSSAHGRGYTLRAFARELNINERTLARMMDEGVKLKAIQLSNMQKLARVFGGEFLKEMGLI